MGGGLMQLSAYGVQDINLTGNPQITFFKVAYRKHTNFSIESIENTYIGDPEFGKKLTFNIARNGDLLSSINLEVELAVNTGELFKNSDSVGDYKYSTKTEDFNGWLLCDGRSLNKNDYFRLFEKIGFSFGGGGLFFNLPDYRGKILGMIGQGTTTEILSPININVSSNTITVQNNVDKWSNGMAVKFTSTGSLPTPLNTSSTYYIIKVNSTTVKLATSLQNAISNTEINLLINGSGTIYMTSTFSNRTLGELSGEEKHGLNINEMPIHTHSSNANGPPTTAGVGYGLVAQTSPISGTVINTDNLGNEPRINAPITALILDVSGGSQNHNNMQPTVFGSNVFIYSGYDSEIKKYNGYLKDYLIRWGFHLIDFVEIEIGGQLIDRHYGEWLDIWTQLTYSKEKYEQLLTMVNTSIESSSDREDYDKKVKVYVPLQFWFCRNPGLALPLIALQHHEVKLNIQLNTKDTINTATRNTSNIVKITNFDYEDGIYNKTNYVEKILEFKVYCDYIFLDTDERRRFAESEHEYLIEQIQTSSLFTTNHNLVEIPLYFNHPCKMIIWRGQRNNFTFQDGSLDTNYNNKYFLSNLYDFNAFGGNSNEENFDLQLKQDIVNTAKLRINGGDRFKSRDGSYFRCVQPMQFLSPNNSSISFYQNEFKRYGGGFYMYNFGLKSDEYQPTGTCNFSRIDNSILSLTLNPYSSTLETPNKCYNYIFRVFAVNYNVLRIISGMGGLAYSN